MTKVVFLVVAACVLVSTFAHPLGEDQDSAASGDEHHGRVQIKVYRGPTEHDGHEHFAPWGYWVKQPADEDHH